MRENNIDIDHVVEITADENEIVARISGRRVHPASGRTYHVIYNPPKQAGIDDETQEALIQRDDDKEETVRKRLTVYAEQTAPLIEYYSNWAQSEQPNKPRYTTVDGMQSVDTVCQAIFAALA